MTAAGYRAWRFVHPDFGAPDELTGLRVSAQGDIEIVEGGEAIRQALLLLISTVPGERVMRPEYGCSLHRLVFSPNDDTTAGLAIHYIRRAIERWEPRIEILRLDATSNETRSEWLDITLEYRVRETRRTDVLKFVFSLAGERT